MQPLHDIKLKKVSQIQEVCFLILLMQKLINSFFETILPYPIGILYEILMFILLELFLQICSVHLSCIVTRGS